MSSFRPLSENVDEGDAQYFPECNIPSTSRNDRHQDLFDTLLGALCS